MVYKKAKQVPDLPRRNEKDIQKHTKNFVHKSEKYVWLWKKAIRDNKSKKYIAKLHYIRRNIIRSLNRIRKHDEKIEKTEQLFRNQKAFNSDHNRFSKNLFSDSTSGSPTFSADTRDNLFKTTYSDEFRDTTYTPPKKHETTPSSHPQFQKWSTVLAWIFSNVKTAV